MQCDLLRGVPNRKVIIDDHFWNNYIGVVDTVVLPFMWELINDRVEGAEKSWCIHNLKVAAGDIRGEHRGAVFQDTDAAKWLEAVAFSLQKKADPRLEALADETIDLIGRAQCEDGYLDTYFIITGTERWSNLMEGHELYTAGHMIEAAVAYYEATGKRKFLDIVSRFADCIDRAFGPEEGKIRGYAGHPEIELALVKLYRATGEERYLKLARFFLNERGAQPNIFDTQDNRKCGKYIFPEFRDFDLDYMQADKPLAEQTEAEGHAVRAGYLYSGMADVAAETGDERMFAQCEILWKDMTERKMYITGSIGSAAYGERMTGAYDLPNDTNYSESCASISLAMFGNRMFRATRDGKYMDIVEKALYNTVLAGIALDGKHYFYVNPLAVDPETAEHNPTMSHVKTTRQQWFGVACCPPNIARTLASMSQYMYAQSEDCLYVNLYIQNEAKICLGDTRFRLRLEADYPNTGKIRAVIAGLKAENEEFALAFRIPGSPAAHISYCLNGQKKEGTTEKGFLILRRSWKNRDTVELELDNSFHFVYANPRVGADTGKTALMRGPWVYCLEEADNGKHLAAVFADTSSEISEVQVEGLPAGARGARFEGCRLKIEENAPLYFDKHPETEKVTLTAVPYCLWNNRGKGEMEVWMNEA